MTSDVSSSDWRSSGPPKPNNDHAKCRVRLHQLIKQKQLSFFIMTSRFVYVGDRLAISEENSTKFASSETI